MTTEAAGAATDALLALVSAGLALTVGKGARRRPWAALFVTLAVTAALGAAGFAAGAELHALPYAAVSAAGGLFVAAASVVLATSRSRPLRRWVYAGVVLTVAGLVVQATARGEGLLSPNALFHLLQTAANACLFRGARVPLDEGDDRTAARAFS